MNGSEGEPTTGQPRSADRETGKRPSDAASEKGVRAEARPERPWDPALSTLRLALTYAALAGVWFILAEFLIPSLRPHPRVLELLQAYKGLAYVVVTTLLLVGLVHAEFRRRQEAASALQKSEERLARILEEVPDGIIITDKDGHVTYANAAVDRMLGLKRQDFLGRHYDAAWKVTTREGAAIPRDGHFLTSVMREQRPVFGVEQVIDVPDGRQTILSVNAAPLWTASGEPDGLVAGLTDITPLKRAEEMLANQLRRMFALHETSLEIASQKDLQSTLEAIVQRAADLVGTHTGGLYLATENGRELELAVMHNFPERFRGTRLQWGEGLSGRVAATGEPLMVEDYSTWEGRAKVYEGAGFRRILAVPLRQGNIIIGVFFVADDEKTDPLSEEDIRLASLFADQAALVIVRARLIDSQERRAGEQERFHSLLTALLHVASKAERGHDLDEVMRSLGEELGVLGRRCCVTLLEPVTRELKVHYVSPPDELMSGAETRELPLVGMQFPLTEPNSYHRLIVEREGLVLDAETLAQGLAQQIPRDFVDRILALGAAKPRTKVLGIPLTTGEEVLGALFVWGDDLEDQDLDAYSLFGIQIASALVQARMLEETRRRATYLEALVSVASALRAAQTRAEMTPVILDRVVNLVDAGGAVLALRDPDTGEAVLDSGVGLWRQFTGLRVPAGEGLAGVALGTAQAYVTADAMNDPNIYWPQLLADLPAVAVVPLIVQDQAIGVLVVGRKTPIDPEELRLMTAIAEISGNALNRAGVMETLERRVHERTRELEEANERLKEVDRLKSEFLSNVSHELRTPITNVMLYLDLLSRAEEDKRPRYLAVLRGESQRLGGLIDDLLTLSRLERGVYPMEQGSFDLDSILAEVVEDQREAARRKVLSLVHLRSPNLPRIKVSRAPMVQVFTNLMSNAVTYTPAGGRVALTSAVGDVRGTRYVTVRVENTGPPIPADEMPHIFERFYRGKTGRESGQPGTGLGLSICKEIVERLGGWIEAESDAKATAFTVGFPLAGEEAPLG